MQVESFDFSEVDYLKGDCLMLHYYRHVGLIAEDNYGEWVSNCGCEGIIDEDFGIEITRNCTNHSDIDRVEWDSELQNRTIGKKKLYIPLKNPMKNLEEVQRSVENAG